MTRIKFLALCARKKNNKGFKVYRQQFYNHRQQVSYRVILDPGVGGAIYHEILYTTTDLAKGVDAENRFNMWLFQEKLHRDQRETVRGAD